MFIAVPPYFRAFLLYSALFLCIASATQTSGLTHNAFRRRAPILKLQEDSRRVLSANGALSLERCTFLTHVYSQPGNMLYYCTASKICQWKNSNCYCRSSLQQVIAIAPGPIWQETLSDSGCITIS